MNAFYSNIYNIKDEVGDLGLHTKYSEKKKNIIFQTDEVGFRNKLFENNPDIIISGQSNIAGSGLSQKQIISEQLERLSEKKVYNISPINIEDVLGLIENEFVNKPNTFIYGIIESQLVPSFQKKELIVNHNAYIIKRTNIYSKIINLIDIIKKDAFVEFLKGHIFYKIYGKNIILGKSGNLYYQGKNMIIYDNKQIRDIVQYIHQINLYCKEQNIEFIFFIIPNKETIYWDDIKLKSQPTSIALISKKLNDIGVTNINTLELFNNNKDKPLYNNDGTHWNNFAVQIIAEQLNKMIIKRSYKNGKGLFIKQ